jgi:hypothetical protein
MAGSGNAVRRVLSFYRDRDGRDSASAFMKTSPAADRLAALAQYRERATEPTGPAGLRADETKPNWVPIGPLGAMHGQAGDLPVVSGRVPGLAVSADGQRVYVASANGGVWRTTDAGRTWEPKSDEFDLDPVRQAVDSLACGAIALFEGAGQSTDRLYVGTGEPIAIVDLIGAGYLGTGMLRSDNGGDSWHSEPSDDPANPSIPPIPGGTPNLLLGERVFSIAIDPTNKNHAMAGTSLGVFRRDAAGTWQLEALPGIAGFAVSSIVTTQLGGQTAFVAVTLGGLTFRWTGNPAPTWTALQTVPQVNAGQAVGQVSLAASPSAPSILYALSEESTNNNLNGVHRMDLSLAAPRWVRLTGITETPQTMLGGQGNWNQAIAVDPRNENRIYVGGSGLRQPAGDEFGAAIYRCDVTPPAGAAVTTAATQVHIGRRSHADVHELVFRPGSSDELWVGCDGGVFFTSNAQGPGPNNFEARNTGLATLTLTGLAAHPTEETWAFAGAQDNGGLRYDGWEIWDHQLGGDGGATVLDPASARILNIFHNGQIRRAAVSGLRYVEPAHNIPGGFTSQFYPPMANSPAQPTFVVFGANRPLVTSTFGAPWAQVNVATPAPAGHVIRALAVVSNVRFYAGWSSGHLARYDFTGGSWRIRNYSRPVIPPAVPGGTAIPAENRPITGITIDPDPAKPNGAAVYVCVGGGATAAAPGAPGHVWHLDTTIDAANVVSVPARWTDRSGAAAATSLLNIQHNAILADPKPGNHQTLWVAADLGVWTSTNGGAVWQPLSTNLPDAAVIDLDLVTIADPKTPAEIAAGDLSQPFRLLRASTFGRGVFEMPLDGIPQPPVELMLRANQLDQRRRRARPAQPIPTSATVPAAQTTLDQSPDIFVDTPNANGQYRFRADRPPTLTELVEPPALANEILASEPGTPAITRVYVVVRNRGVRKVDGVLVSLLVGPKDAALPANYRACARGGALADENGWKLADTTTVNGLRAGTPKVATLTLSSEKLPPLSDSVGDDYQVIVLLHHADDPFPDGAPADTTDPTTLVARVRQTSMRKVKVVSGARRAAPNGGTGLLVSMSTTLLAHRRLTAISKDLTDKVTTAPANKVHPVERRVAAMVKAALTTMEAGDKPRVDENLPGAKVSTYALLGSLGFELPAYASAFLAGGGWVAENLRRGTGDPHLSRVAVPASELPLKLAGLGKSVTDAKAKTAIGAFSTGLLASAASGAVLSPQLADLLAQDTNADWHPGRRSRGSAALEHHLRQHVLGGASGVTSVASWLPLSAEVPPGLWEQYVKAIEQTYGLPGQRPHGFGSFEADFDEGYWINARRIAGGYGILLEDARAGSWSAPAWWGLLTPILIAPSLSLIAARALPHSKAFFEGGELTERSVFELLAVSMGFGALAPFVYSMLMWSKVEDHTEAFATALLMFLARGGLVGAALGTSGDEGQGAAVRWAGMFPPLVGADVYAGLRAALDNERHPGNSTVFALQTLPAITGLTTFGLAGLARAIGGGDTERDETKDDVAFWLITLGAGAAFLTALGIPVAMALSKGGGWQSWFMRDTSGLPLLSAVAHAGVEPLTPTAAARVYENSSLWPAPTASVTVDQQNYPPGTRPLVRVWWNGNGELKMKYGDSTLRLRHDGGETVVDLTDPTNATNLVTQIEAALPGLKAEVIGEDTPALNLPRPKGLADAGDEAAHEAAEALRTAFVRVPTRKGNALILRQSPRVKHSATAGRALGAAAPYIVFPADVTKDDPGSGLIDAADLAALLMTAAAPSVGDVTVADNKPALTQPRVREAVQVFRRWNLNERRLDEWQSLVTGHGGTAPSADPVRNGNNTLVREPPTQLAPYAPQSKGRDVAEAMGWLPLWRAWLNVAADKNALAGGEAIHAKTPLVTFPTGAPRKPKNRELTEGISFLLDMGMT